MPSALYNLTKNDWLKGLIVTVLGAVLGSIVSLLQNGGHIDLKQVGITALISGCSYILKQFGTDANGKLLGKI